MDRRQALTGIASFSALPLLVRPQAAESYSSGYALGELILHENPYADAPTYAAAIAAQIETLEGVLAALRRKMATAPADDVDKREALRESVKGYGELVDGPAAENGGAALITKPTTPMLYAEAHRRIMSGLFWDFGGTPHRISKALRLPYTLPGDPEEYAIFIGYGGCGGW